jgi:hypothetical protein
MPLASWQCHNMAEKQKGCMQKGMCMSEKARDREGLGLLFITMCFCRKQHIPARPTQSYKTELIYS